MNYIFSKLTECEMTRSGGYLHEQPVVFSVSDTCI